MLIGVAGVIGSMTDRLPEEEIQRKLPAEWRRVEGELVREFSFDEYLSGVRFAVECAEIADEENHHPLIAIGFGTVEVRLTTHDAGGVTEKDLYMAELFNELS